MKPNATYLVPSLTVSARQEIKRSRFIATVGRIGSINEAIAFLEKTRGCYPGARHHCWAYIAGPPSDGTPMAKSDDGEPRGTAGKPILNLLRQEGIGEVAAVVSRYFGGVKLGTGGLVRAYSGTLKLALAELEFGTFVPTQSMQITLPYAHEDAARRLLKKMKAIITQTVYDRCVVITLEMPENGAAELCRQLHDKTRGSCTAVRRNT